MYILLHILQGFLPGIVGVSHGALQFMAYEKLKELYNRYHNRCLNAKLVSLTEANTQTDITFATHICTVSQKMTFAFNRMSHSSATVICFLSSVVCDVRVLRQDD